MLQPMIDHLRHVSGPISGIDVHFEDATSGFFIREAEAGTSVQPASSPGASALERSLRNLTVFGTRRSVSIKSSHGPFLSRQTISVNNFPGETSDTKCNFANLKWISTKQLVI